MVNIGESPSSAYKHAVSSIEVDAAGGEIVINGAGFGGGPNVILYDNFDNGGSPGDEIPIVNGNNIACSTDPFGLDVDSTPGPQIGCWTQTYSAEPPVYSDIAHSGNRSMLAFDQGALERKFYLDFPNSTELFLSYRAHVPPGDYFPGRWYNHQPKQPGVFPDASSIKIAWVQQDRGQGIYLANQFMAEVVYGGWKMGGEPNVIANPGHGTTYWSWNHFTKFSMWLQANPANVLGNGNMIFQVMSQDKGFYQASSNGTPIFVHNAFPAGHPNPKGPNEKYFNNLVIPGWIRNTDDLAGQWEGTATEAFLFDDIYFAIGPNSVSRVEIGDAPTMLGNTQLAIQIPVTWNDGQIKVSVEELLGMNISDGYLYIIDNEGNFNPNGYPLK